MSLAWPGSGHVLLGANRRGVLWWSVSLVAAPGLIWLVDVLPSATAVGVALWTWLLLVLALPIGALVDVLRLRAPATAPPGRRVLLLLGGLLTVSLLAETLVDTGETVRERYVEAFRLPAGSMRPTLVPGDHLLVNKFVYRFADPKRGDVIVFKYPPDESRDFIKRIIAVGSEDFSIKDRKIYVDCKPPEPTCRPIEDPWGWWDGRSGGSETTSVRVPPGSYFVMGDNRNNSQDSRYWGFVKREKIEGRAFLIYWSLDRERDESRLWERVRWSRLGKLVY
jgi:signal peptidase I